MPAVPYVTRPFVPDIYEPRGRIGDYQLRAANEMAEAMRRDALLRANLINTVGEGIGSSLREIAAYPERQAQQRAAAEKQAAADQRADREFAQKQAEFEQKQREYDAKQQEQAQARERQARLDATAQGDALGKVLNPGSITQEQMDALGGSPVQAARTRYSFGPGTAEGPELMPTPEQVREKAVEEAVGTMGGVLGPNGQIVMHQKPAAEKAPAVGSLEDYLRQKYGPRPTSQQIEQGLRTYGDLNRAEPKGTGGALNLPGAYGTAFSRAILNAAPMKRAGLIQTANDIAATGTEDDIKSLIRQAAIEGENVDVKNQVLGRQSTIRALADAKKLITDMKAQGVPTGILSGSFEDVARKLGKTTNPQYVRLKQNLQDVLINYRRAATGAAFGENEGKAYAQMFPAYTNDLPVNVALLDGLSEAMSNRDRAYWEYKLGAEGANLVSASSAKKNPFKD